MRAALTTVALASCAALLVLGCKSINEPNTDTRGAIEATGTVQATLSPDAAANTPGDATQLPADSQAKLASFAGSVRSPVWAPTYLPKGFKVYSVDVVELEPGTGLVCDMTLSDGAKGLSFVQGSPKRRSYEIVSAGKVPWGIETADVVYEDPEDKTARRMIVYSRNGTLAELSGDVSFTELKSVAASMKSVK